METRHNFNTNDAKIFAVFLSKSAKEIITTGRYITVNDVWNWIPYILQQEIDPSLRQFILNKFLECVDLLKNNSFENENLQEQGVDKMSVKKTSIEDLNELPIRAYNCLIKIGVRSVEDLIIYGRKKLKKLDGIGTGTLNGIEKALKKGGHPPLQE